MLDILHRVIEPSLIACVEIKSRNAIWEELDRLLSICVNYICGPLFLMYETQNEEIKELGYPVIKQINDSSLETKIIGRCEVFSTFHFGSYDEIDGVIHSFLNSLGDVIDRSDLLIKEIYHEFYPEKDDENVIEIQVIIPLEIE
ncbi:hypothetical protein EU527_07810 [Candidatus Thorarchaeota archaeon]|nr:MAG: hypothetical protein EU527_07810 [Candidatus Thorarchaeota archaeon]